MPPLETSLTHSMRLKMKTKVTIWKLDGNTKESLSKEGGKKLKQNFLATIKSKEAIKYRIPSTRQ